MAGIRKLDSDLSIDRPDNKINWSDIFIRYKVGDTIKSYSGRYIEYMYIPKRVYMEVFSDATIFKHPDGYKRFTIQAYGTFNYKPYIIIKHKGTYCCVGLTDLKFDKTSYTWDELKYQAANIQLESKDDISTFIKFDGKTLCEAKECLEKRLNKDDKSDDIRCQHCGIFRKNIRLVKIVIGGKKYSKYMCGTCYYNWKKTEKKIISQFTKNVSYEEEA